MHKVSLHISWQLLICQWNNFRTIIFIFTGDDLGSYILRENVLRQEQITSPSLAFLMPSKLFWKSTDILVETDKKNYTINDMEEFFRYENSKWISQNLL